MGCASSSPKKKEEEEFKQVIVILRHSERLDHVLGPAAYKASEEGKAWPFDSPLTQNGITLAKEVAAELLELHKSANFACLASSPYHRCMQTAAEVAKLLGLPLMIDQEMGEVWEEAMPSDAPPHRSPKELQAMAKELGVKVRNPVLPEGGFKLFGKRTQSWPETLEQGHKRCTVRVEYYIEQSTTTKQNFIIVSHAPAVAALADIFNRGSVDVADLQYCARVIAERKVPGKLAATATADMDGKPGSVSVFTDTWQVEAKGVSFELNIDATEETHAQTCEETQERVETRRLARTRTDTLLEGVLKNVTFDEDDEEDGAQAAKV